MRKMYTLSLLLSASTMFLWNSEQGFSSNSWRGGLANFQFQIPGQQPVQPAQPAQPANVNPGLQAVVQPLNVQPQVPAQQPAHSFRGVQLPANFQFQIPGQQPAQPVNIARPIQPVVQHNVQPQVLVQQPARPVNVARPIQPVVQHNVQPQVLVQQPARPINVVRPIQPVVQRNVQPQVPVQQPARPGIDIIRIKNILLSDQLNYNRFNDMAKIDVFMAHCPSQFNSEVKILSFAKRVNDEPSFQDDVVAQIREVKRSYMISVLNGTEEGNYNDNIETRGNLYTFIRSPILNPNRNALLENITDHDFMSCIIDLKAATGRRPDQNFDKDNSLTINRAIEILGFERTLKHDQKRLKAEFDRKVDNLQVDFSAANPGHYTMHLNPEPDLGMEAVECLSEVDRLQNLFVRNPLQLNIMKITFQDYASTIFSMEFTPVTNAEFLNLKQTALSLIDPNNFTARLRIGQVPLTPAQVAQEYRQETMQNFDRVLREGARRDFWKERITKVFELAPASLVSSAIARPGAVNYNAQAWNTALKEQQIFVLQQINGIFYGCQTGVSQKLKLVEQAYSSVLKTITPEIEMIGLVGNIVRKLKIARINELGDRLTSPESIVTVPHVAMQRLRIPLGLLGTYEEIAFGVFGNHTLAQNHPTQVFRNMFDPTQQPARLSNTYGGAQFPVKPRLTVKSLVQAVVDEFNVTIKYEHVKPFVSGCLDLHLDSFNSAIEMENGVFFRADGHIDVDDRRIENEFFSKPLAFYILEKLEYVKIDNRVKAAVYKLDQDGRPGKYNNTTLLELIDRF